MGEPDLIGGDGGWLQDRLFARRVVLLRGPLHDETAGAVAAQLMALDGLGDGPISLQLDSPGGPLAAAFTVMDTIDLCGVPVEVTAQGRVEGTALGVLAVAHRRQCLTHTSFRLSLPLFEAAFGRASQLRDMADHYRRDVERYLARVSAACRRPVEHIEAELDTGRYIDAEQAQALGYIDEVLAPGRRSPSPDTPRFPFGFQPPSRS